ncbi:hypothetical protein AX14_001675 [Amanita brunnescens Koide BX004]|nr:hypothetical protein AX14_001675 [Amanita brunnescens Koide BX004]
MHSFRDTKYGPLEQHAERISSRVAAVQERRKVIYERARNQAGSISTIGLNHIEDIWANLRQLREQELLFQRFAANYTALKSPKDVLELHASEELAN